MPSPVTRYRRVMAEKPSCDSSFPHADEDRRLGGLLLCVPHLGRRMAVQMLMRSRMVVPGTKLHQLHPQVVGIDDPNPIQLTFERPEETFDPPVLPWAMKVGGLQADTQQRQRSLHQPRVETRLVVHPNALRQTKLVERADQFVQNRGAAFVGQRTQSQASARTMIEQPQHQMLPETGTDRKPGRRLRFPHVFMLPQPSDRAVPEMVFVSGP